MKRCKRILSLLLVLIFVIALVPTIPVSAADADGSDSETRYTQKIVSVVYDNSGSMTDEKTRISSAKYSLSMLMSLLSDRDQMTISPMNNKGSSVNQLVVNLSATDRNAEIDRIMALPEFTTYYGSTPHASIGNAVTRLTESGLQDAANAINSDPNKEYWLIVLTDGEFSSPYTGRAGEALEKYIKDYPSLHSTFVSFGNAAGEVDPNQLSKYKVDAYNKVNEGDLPSVIQTISNKIAGRYTLDESLYNVNGSTVTVDLEQVPFSLSSLALMAQNCGAELVSATHSESTISIKKPCIIAPGSELGLSAAYSCELVGNPYIFKGNLVLEFSAPVDPNMLSLFAEPALEISYHLEALVDGSWQTVDSQYINEKLQEGNDIRVQYEVREQVNGDPIDLEAVFGGVSAKVLYDQKTFSTGENISLVEGTKELSVEVSVMNGQYTLRDSEMLTILKDPSHYRIESDGPIEVPEGGGKINVSFTVYIDNFPASKDDFGTGSDKYQYTVVAKAGTHEMDTVKSLGSDGKINVSFNVPEGLFNVYKIDIKVTSPQKLTRTASHSVAYYPKSLTLSADEPSHLTIKQYALNTNDQGFSFSLKTGNVIFPIVNDATNYKLTVDGVDLTKYATVADNSNVLTFTPTAENLGSIVDTPGDKEIVLTLSSATHPYLATSAKATLTIEKTVFEVVPVNYGSSMIDRFDLANTDAALYFAIMRDGVSISRDELQAAWDSGALKLDIDKAFSSLFWLPCATETSIEEVDGTPVLAVKVVRDMGTYFDWHYSAFIFKSERPVTATYGDSTSTVNFVFEEAGAFAHIIRIFLLIFVHVLIFYIILYIIGFWKAKALPTGAFVKITEYGSEVVPVNDTFIKKYGWHVIRFFTFWKVWAYQSLGSQNIDCSGITLGYDKKYPLAIHFLTDDGNTYPAAMSSNVEKAFDDYCEYVEETRDYDLSFIDHMKKSGIKTPPSKAFRQADAALLGASVGEMSSKAMYIRLTSSPGEKKKSFVYAVCFFQF